MKDSYLRARFLRLKARCGPKKVFVAIAAEILRASNFILLRKVPYHDLGPDHFDGLECSKATLRHARRLQFLGYGIRHSLLC